LADVEKEAEAVREVLSSLTGAEFEVSNTPDDFRNQSLNPRWFVRCKDMKQARNIPYLNEAWKQSDGTIWLESLPLGDTIDWIEAAYGEESAAKSIDVNYSDFGSKKFQAEFGSEYPLVYQRIQTYEEVAGRVSKSQKVHVELRNSGSKGIVVFTYAARLTETDAKSLSKKLEASVEALKEAYTQAMQV
jgi:hypothetical protein